MSKGISKNGYEIRLLRALMDTLEIDVEKAKQILDAISQTLADAIKRDEYIRIDGICGLHPYRSKGFWSVNPYIVKGQLTDVYIPPMRRVRTTVAEPLLDEMNNKPRRKSYR